jgi:hypothetical protein
MADEGDAPSRRFSTDLFPEHERLTRWREEFGRTVVQVDIEPLARDLPFKAEAFLQSLPGVRLAWCSGSATRLDRTRQLAADGGGLIGLIVNLGDPALVSQRGRDFVLAKGDAVFVDSAEAAVLTGETHLNLPTVGAGVADQRSR